MLKYDEITSNGAGFVWNSNKHINQMFLVQGRLEIMHLSGIFSIFHKLQIKAKTWNTRKLL